MSPHLLVPKLGWKTGFEDGVAPELVSVEEASGWAERGSHFSVPLDKTKNKLHGSINHSCL